MGHVRKKKQRQLRRREARRQKRNMGKPDTLSPLSCFATDDDKTRSQQQLLSPSPPSTRDAKKMLSTALVRQSHEPMYVQPMVSYVAVVQDSLLQEYDIMDDFTSILVEDYDIIDVSREDIPYDTAVFCY